MLVTGFGPFPGVQQNASSDLAQAVCDALTTLPNTKTTSAIEAHCAVLSVDWDAVSQQMSAAYGAHKPNLALHFGVSQTAHGLKIERMAHNDCAIVPDQKGATPTSALVHESASETLTTKLPVPEIVAECRSGKIDVAMSDDAGRYLCNAAYFTSLGLAANQARPCEALFVHMPADIAPGSQRWPALLEAACTVATTTLNHLISRTR